MDETERLERAQQMAEEAGGTDGARCIKGEAVFYLSGPRALVPGHIYSRAGMNEFKISQCCEYHYDLMMQPPLDYDSGSGRKQALEQLLEGRRHVLYDAPRLDIDYDGSQYLRGEVTSLDDANVVSSELYDDRGRHTVALDIDHPARLVPSSTPGHWHLLIDVTMDWERYREVLIALAGAGVIQEGYMRASLEREGTHLRLPWVKKIHGEHFEDAPEVKDA